MSPPAPRETILYAYSLGSLDSYVTLWLIQIDLIQGSRTIAARTHHVHDLFFHIVSSAMKLELGKGYPIYGRGAFVDNYTSRFAN